MHLSGHRNLSKVLRQPVRHQVQPVVVLRLAMGRDSQNNLRNCYHSRIVQSFGRRLRRTLPATRSYCSVLCLLLATGTISIGFADTLAEPMLLPIEVLSASETTAS